jgi:hypothetical protein
MTDFVTIISTVGFPIASCLALGLYVYKATETNKQELTKTNEKLQEIIEKTTECITNNTNALYELKDSITKKEA